MKYCKVANCERPHKAKRMCASHYAGAWNRANRKRYNRNWRKFYENHAVERVRRERARTVSRYGISLPEYDRMQERQEGVCAICRRAERSRLKYGGTLRSLAVDHCHRTNKVRGLLCSSCNRGIAKFGDDPAILRAAAAYLERTNG